MIGIIKKSPLAAAISGAAVVGMEWAWYEWGAYVLNRIDPNRAKDFDELRKFTERMEREAKGSQAAK